MCTVEKGSVGEGLRKCETQAEQKERNTEVRPSFSVRYVPPIWQVRTDGQHRGLEHQECDKEPKVTPKEARNLRLNSGTSELERRDITARYPATSVCKRKKDFEERIGDYGRLLQSVGSFCQQQEKCRTAEDQKEENDRQDIYARMRD
jgi:hypothetical protein